MKRVFSYLFSGVLLAGLLLAPAFAEESGGLKIEAVDYSSPGEEGVVLKGYLAFDPAVGKKRPGVIVVHEWWGHNDYARRRARMLAEMGYTALAIDMYGDGKEALHPDDAAKFSGEVMSNRPVARARFLAAVEILKNHDSVDAERIAAIGYCFGGSLVLHMARSGADLKGVASFHGGLAGSKTDAPGEIKAKLLVVHGGDDAFEPPEVVEEFRAEMKTRGAKMRFVTYQGAKHSFTNPDADKYAKKFNLPLEYNEQADKNSWNELAVFLGKVFE